MSKKYPYRPPVKYLFVGLGGILLSIIFGMACRSGEAWFAMVSALFGLLTLAMGVGFLALYFRRLSGRYITIDNDYIEVPTQGKTSTRIKIQEIVEVQSFDTYDEVIAIKSKEDKLLVERSWMRKQDFDLLKQNFSKLGLNH